MERTPLVSESIRSAGYDAGVRILELEFHSGGTYQYFDVPELVFQELINAESHGSYFLSHIKDAYSYQRVE